MNGKSMLNKFDARMSAIKPLLTYLNAIDAVRAKKAA